MANPLPKTQTAPNGLSLQHDRVLFFPVTPFGADGALDPAVLRAHVGQRLDASPGAVFTACGTGEYHTLSLAEYRSVVSTVVNTVRSEAMPTTAPDQAPAASVRVPVVTGTGGPLGHAVEAARIAEGEGADGLLVMPSYLVRGPQDGLVRYVEAIAAASSLPLIVYHRGNAQFTAASAEKLFADRQVIGFKDGVGDLAVAQELVRAADRAGRPDALFFNGLPTAELTQAAFDGIGIRFYSSAVFAMAPEIANAFFRTLRSGDEAMRTALLDAFYSPLVALRDESPGFAIALIKTGVRLTGLDVGPVRPPLVDPTPEQTARLQHLLDTGRELVAGYG